MPHFGSAPKDMLALPREQVLGRLDLADLETKNGCGLAVS